MDETEHHRSVLVQPPRRLAALLATVCPLASRITRSQLHSNSANQLRLRSLRVRSVAAFLIACISCNKWYGPHPHTMANYLAV